MTGGSLDPTLRHAQSRRRRRQDVDALGQADALAGLEPSTLLLTGLPRSGTTLSCALLNRLPNVLALSEPLMFGGLDTREEALATISGFLEGVRETALKDGVAPTKSDGDWMSDNFMEPPKPDGGLRKRSSTIRPMEIGKPLSPDFLLCIKEPGLFTALAEELANRYRLFALIRSPLSVLASWQTIDFPVQRGHLLGAERLDEDLRVRLGSIEDRLERQVELIAWFLSAYAKLPARRVLRYEDLILDPRSQLRPMVGRGRGVSQVDEHRITEQAPEDRYPGVDFQALARRLHRIAPLIERFYPGYGETLTEVMAGHRTALRYRGADGRGGKVNMFVAGVAKGGTTALASYLGRHPAIRMANRKEVHWFDQDELRPEADYERYHVCFRPPVEGATVIGEATPAYVYWPKTLERLKAYNPDARIIVLLRHPTFRAYSQWRMERARERETLDFSAAIRAERSRRLTMKPERVRRIFSYLERGQYGLQIAALLSHFPRSQCHFLRTDSLWSAPEQELRAIHDFLGVTPIGVGEAGRYVAPALEAIEAAIPLEDRVYLDQQFRDQIIMAQELSGLDLSDWLTADYLEPMGNPPVSPGAQGDFATPDPH